MQLFTGSALSLKKHFLQNLQALKTNPLERVLVLIPSKHLETRIKKELCQDILCLAGVDFMPLSGLARNINQTSQTPVPPLAEDNPLLDFKIKNLLDRHGFTANRDLAICFKNSFRDLINAEVTPEVLSSVKEDEELVLDEQKIYLTQIIPLYADFLEIQKEPGRSTYKDFFVAARNNAKNNPFLNSFKQIIFYGFYDFTSLHYELISAVINNYQENTQVYLPYEKHPAYTFAEPSFSTLFLPLATEHIELESENNPIKNAAENIFTPEQKRAYDADITLIKVSGEGEVQAAAKKILEMHKNGISYGDMALTFRTESPFNNKILEVFKQNQIPINYNFTFPLIQKPFAAFVYNLFHLERNNFAREDVLSVLNSPYFAFKQEGWANLVQQSGVECSVTQFEEMLPADNPAAKRALMDVLKEIKSHLIHFQKEGSFENLANQAKKFLLDYTGKKAQEEQAEVLNQIIKILDLIATYSTTGKKAKANEFLEEFFALLKEASFNKVFQAPDAVEVADIMTLRLQDFKAVIILGLNEGLLPLMPEQDPALKEVYRQGLKKLLRNTLKKIGYLIHTRQDRYFEENFLFYLTLSAAQNKAVLTYKTSDEEGKHLVKSIFITLLLTVLAKTEFDLPSFSRRPFERLKNDIKQEFLTKEEAANLIALINPNYKEILANLISKEGGESSFETDYFNLKALSSLGALTSFDGIIKQDEAKQIYPQEFSPTSLSNLYSCPAKYFFSKIANDQNDISSRGALAINKQGTLYHKILQDFYKNIQEKLPLNPIEEIEEYFLDFIKQEFNNMRESYGLYPLLWESIKQEITENLLNFIKKDISNMRETQFYPVEFEANKCKTLNLDNKNFNLNARIDRIDKKPDTKEFRAIDYKKKTDNGNIFVVIFQENKLQPPLYLEILNCPNKPEVFTSASFYYVEHAAATLGQKTLGLEDYNKISGKFLDLLAFMHKLTLEGIFPIAPNGKTSCEFCNFADICRKNHLQTLRRAKKSEFYKKLRKFHYAFER